MTDNAFKAQDIGLRAQKKILSRMATKSVAKVFIDGVTSSLLDNVYRLLKQYVSIYYILYIFALSFKINFLLIIFRLEIKKKQKK